MAVRINRFTVRSQVKASQLTSCDGERCKLVLCHREPRVVVGRDLEVVPRGRVQVQDHEVAAGLDAVGHQGPVLVVPARLKIAIEISIITSLSCRK